MGKLLNLGTKLKYPITITKLHKQEDEKISKQQGLLEYKWTWKNEVGDTGTTGGVTWIEDQTSYGDWDSPVDGTIKSWMVHVGMVIEKDMKFVEVEEDCPHSIQFQGLCGMCGKDMTEVGYASSFDDTSRAQISMIHDQTSLKVSQDEASKAEEELQRRLLKHRKLSLVVDLDQTIIQACVEPTIGEWRDNPASPNHDAVKDVRSFQLEDGPRGVASGCWYYVKLRPGLQKFLSKVSQLYEMHVYTMGTRAYARNVAKIVDPDKSLFGDRIISRDENGSISAKNLARLFPVDTKMVAIIDDRADVWPMNRSNLIKVVAYDFFPAIGDINASFLPKKEELPKSVPTPKKKLSEKSEEKTGEKSEGGAEGKASDVTETSSGDATVPIDNTTLSTADDAKESPNEESSKPVSALEELVRMGGGDDQALRLEQTAEQEKSLEAQLIARPLLHLQEKLDQEDETEAIGENGKNGTEHHHHRHNLLQDDDDELVHLEKHLEAVHKAFYDEYDGAITSARGGRVAQLKPGISRKIAIRNPGADLRIVPDISVVMPRLKSKVFEGCTIVTSGIVPLNLDVLRSELGLQILSFGAKLKKKITRKVTHLVTSNNKARTTKVKQAAQRGHIKIVNQQWLVDSMSKWEKQNEDNYLVEIHESDRKIRSGNLSDISIHESDDSLEDSHSGSDSEDEDHGEREEIPGSQEEFTDDEGVMPHELEPGQSPIDDMGDFNWGDLDEELQDLGSDSEESDNGSIASESDYNGDDRKRKYNGFTDEEDSDDGSNLSKRQRTSNSRPSSLKGGKLPSKLSKSSLPTPAVTGDEDGDEGMARGDDDDFDADLEADLLAEFEKEEAEAEASADGAG